MTWVCIIDDDPQVGDALTDALRTAGYGARSFRDGSDALAAIADAVEAPRLVLLDLILPNIDGREVVRRIRVEPHAAQVPIIVITGMDGVTEAAFSPWRVSAVLRKPVAIDDLLQAMTAALRGTSA